MKARILGCGPSYGVPSLARGFGECDPGNPKNIRTRSSMLLETEHGNFLFDTAPEIREQLIAAGRPKIDSVIYTHSHYDHMGGAEDLRKASADKENRPSLPIYLCREDEKRFCDLLYFAFPPFSKDIFFDVRVIRPYHTFTINGLDILPIRQYHGDGLSMGYRVGDFAYSTDVKSMDEKGFDLLKGIKTWIMGVVTPTINEKHINIDEAMQWIDRIKPDRVFFTHMGTKMDYDRLCKMLPAYIRPVYDTMVIDL